MNLVSTLSHEEKLPLLDNSSIMSIQLEDLRSLVERNFDLGI